MPHPASVLAALACAALIAPLRPLAQTPPQPPSPGSPRILRVNGEGRVRVSPDVAVVVAGIQASGPELGKVTKDVAERMRKVQAALAELGIAQKDVQTARHDVTVERDWKNGRQGPIKGYTVVDELRVTVRSLDKVGPALDRVTAAGANELRGLTFQKDDPTPERARALAAAYGAARAKAEALAKAAGVTLGEVLQLGESTQSAPIPMDVGLMRMEAKEASATPVAPGEVEIAATVDVVYAIR
jgi:uncharacterized protein YggE